MIAAAITVALLRFAGLAAVRFCWHRSAHQRIAVEPTGKDPTCCPRVKR